MSKTAKIIIIVVIASLGLGGLGVYVGLNAFKVSQATEADKAVMVGPMELKPYFEGLEVEEKDVSYMKMQVMGTNTQIHLNYSGSLRDQFFNINSTLQHASKESAAKQAYQAAWQSTIMGFKIG